MEEDDGPDEDLEFELFFFFLFLPSFGFCGRVGGGSSAGDAVGVGPLVVVKGQGIVIDELVIVV